MNGDATRPEYALVQRAVAGDREALALLYRRYYPRVFALAVRLTRDVQLAEDVAQEALLRILDGRGPRDSTRPLWPWLKVIATRLTVDLRRRRSRELMGEPDDDMVAAESASSEQRVVLDGALSRLTPRERVALVLRYLEDRGTAEAASLLGLSVPAFEQLLFRARSKLRLEYRGISWR